MGHRCRSVSLHLFYRLPPTQRPFLQVGIAVGVLPQETTFVQPCLRNRSMMRLSLPAVFWSVT